MSAVLTLQNSFDQKITDALQVSEFLEQGQADMPLTDLFKQLRQDLQRSPFAVTLLCLTEDSRSAALKWLYGHNFAVFSVQLSKQVGLLEVHLKDRGHSLESSTGDKQEFDNWEALVGMLEGQPAEQAEAKSELRLSTQAATGIKQLTLLVPESPSFIQQSPALITRLLRDTNVLMVAAPPSYAMPEEERKIINTLLDDMDCFIPLMPVNELADDMNLPDYGWWESLNPKATLPLQLLTTHVEASLPNFLCEPTDDMRQSLLMQQLSKKYNKACDAVAEQFADAQRQLNSRKKREQRKQQAEPNSVLVDNQQSSNMRTRINDCANDLGKAVEEACRKRELLTSEQATRIKNAALNLTDADLDKEDSYKSYKLSLGEKYQSELMQLLTQEARTDLKLDVEELHKALASYNDELLQSLNKSLGYRPTLSTIKLERGDIWYDLEQVLAMEVRYQGELPKRGFFERLGAGRQAMMGLMMAAMILGGLIPELRKILMIFGLPLFFIGMAWSFISFPKEEKARLDKELKRVRDEVLNNARRLNTEVNRHKTSRLRDYLEKVKKDWLEQVERIQSEAGRRQQSEQQKQSDVARKRVQGIEQQLADLQRYQMPMSKLTSGAEQIARESQRNLEQQAAKA